MRRCDAMQDGGGLQLTRVALVLPEMLPVPPVRGGAVEHWVHEATRRLPAEGLDITIFSRPAGVPGHSGIKYASIPWGKFSRWAYALKEKFAERKLLRGVAKLQNVWGYGAALRPQLYDFDVVCIENDPNLVLFMPRKPGQKLILHMHNDHLSSRTLRWHYRRQLRNVDRVLFCSDFIRQRAATAFPEFAAKFSTLVNTTDVDFFVPIEKQAARQEVGFGGTSAPLVVYAGRLVAEKGVHVLIEAFVQLQGRCPDARLLIAGASFFAESQLTPYQLRLAALAKPVEDAITFLGYVPHARIRALYSAADVVVVPSVWQEPFGLVVIEAMACGATVVASSVGGIPEIINHGLDGVLVPPGDATRLCEAMVQLIENSDGGELMRQAARSRIEEAFSWKQGATAFWQQLGVSA